MALPYLSLQPHSPNYTADIAVGAVVFVKLDGGAGRYRRDYIGATSTIAVEWILDPDEYNDLYNFFHNILFSGALPFTIPLIFESSTVSLYQAHFVPDTFKLVSQIGLSYTVQASLEVVPGNYIMAGSLSPESDGSFDETITHGSEGITPSEYGLAFGTDPWGFNSLPPDAVLTGIEVSFERYISNILLEANTAEVKLYQASAPVGIAKSSIKRWTTDIVTETYGGPTDLWGYAWGSADIAGPGFGFGIKAHYRNDSGSTSYHLIGQNYKLKVYYIIP